MLRQTSPRSQKSKFKNAGEGGAPPPGGEGGGILVQYKPAQSETCIMYIFTRFLKLMTDGADRISSGSMVKVSPNHLNIIINIYVHASQT